MSDTPTTNIGIETGDLPDDARASTLVITESRLNAHDATVITHEPRCATCRWYTPIKHRFYVDEGDPEATHGDTSGRGTCGGVPSVSDEPDDTRKPNFRAYTGDASGYRSWLSVRDDFGCIEWEAQ